MSWVNHRSSVTALAAVLLAAGCAAIACSPALAQPAPPGSAAIPYSGSISNQTAIGFLTSDGRLTPVTSTLMNQSTVTPTVVETATGYLTIFEGNNGAIQTAPLSPGGALGPTQTLQGTSSAPLISLTSAPAVRVNGELILTGINNPTNASTSQLIVARFTSTGSLLNQQTVTIQDGFPTVLSLLANPDGSVWVTTQEAGTVTARLFTPQGAQVTEQVVSEPSSPEFSVDAAGDGGGGIFLLVNQGFGGSGPSPPTVLRAIHVDEGGGLQSRFVGQGSNTGGEILALGNRARIIYHSYSSRGGGIYTRRFNAAGAITGRRKLARTGVVQETIRYPGSVGVRILRKRRGLRIHRLPLRRRLTPGRVVIGSAQSGTFAYDDARRAYISWTVPNLSPGCSAATMSNLQDVYARVIGATSRPVRLVSACADVQPLVAE